MLLTYDDRSPVSLYHTPLDHWTDEKENRNFIWKWIALQSLKVITI